MSAPPGWSRSTIGRTAVRALLLSLGLGAPLACSFAWDDYRPPEATGPGSGGSAGGGASASTAGGAGPCTSTQKVCGGQCVEIDDPDYGCSDNLCDACSIPNATATCVAGSCTFDACLRGYDDCDGAPGCETSISTNAQHCGGCDQPCDGTSCVNGMCGTENCVNRIDDDSNGLVDCEDPGCVTFECVVVDNPWKGPVFLYDGDYATKPDCSAVPGVKELEGYNGLMFDAPTCSGCSCAPPVVNCALAALSAYDLDNCTGTLVSSAQGAPDVCDPGPGGIVQSVRIAAPTVSASCAPAGGAVTANPYTWQTAGVACMPNDQGGGCSGQGVCVGNAPASFGPKPCVYRNGDNACPAGFDVKHLFYEGAEDSRACTPCSCSAPGGSGSCSVSTTVYTGTGCTGTPVAVANSNTCTDVSGAASKKATVNITDNFSACSAAGGMPTGSVEETSVTTVCCRP